MSEKILKPVPPSTPHEEYVHLRFHELATATQAVVLSSIEHTVTQERQTVVMEQQAELLKRLTYAIEGNGKPGLKAEVIGLTNRLDAHDEAADRRAAELKDKAENQKFLLRLVIGIVSTILTTGIIAFSGFAWAQYKQVRSLIDNQETVSRQIQELPGAKPQTPIVNPDSK